MSEPIVSVYAVFADTGEAERIGRDMIERGLAACVNIFGACHSIYRWQGRIEEAREVPALFKTRADRAAELMSAIAAVHSYDVPAVVTWPIGESHEAYRRWIVGE